MTVLLYEKDYGALSHTNIFHRNIRKKLKELGLENYIENGDGSLADFTKLIWSTALVPPEHLQWYWEHVVIPAKPELMSEENLDPDELQNFKKDYEERIDQFLLYLEKTYIGYIDRNHKLKEPQFKVSDWNKHSLARTCDSLTTNKAEVGVSFSLLLHKTQNNV